MELRLETSVAFKGLQSAAVQKKMDYSRCGKRYIFQMWKDVHPPCHTSLAGMLQNCWGPRLGVHPWGRSRTDVGKHSPVCSAFIVLQHLCGRIRRPAAEWYVGMGMGSRKPSSGRGCRGLTEWQGTQGSGDFWQLVLLVWTYGYNDSCYFFCPNHRTFILLLGVCVEHVVSWLHRDHSGRVEAECTEQ